MDTTLCQLYTQQLGNTSYCGSSDRAIYYYKNIIRTPTRGKKNIKDTSICLNRMKFFYYIVNR